MIDNDYMERALELAEENVKRGGWPFSTVIVRDGHVLAEAVNEVKWSHDPSDHAEVAAIRKATSKLGSPDLSGCTMYMVAPPCPMCMTCMILANVERVVYGVGVARKDEALSNLPPTGGLYKALEAGFDDGPVQFDQLASYEQQGYDVFKGWNDAT